MQCQSGNKVDTVQEFESCVDSLHIYIGYKLYCISEIQTLPTHMLHIQTSWIVYND